MSNSQMNRQLPVVQNPPIESLITKYGSPERMLKLQLQAASVLVSVFPELFKLEDSKK